MKQDLPLPVIPGLSVALAPFNTPMHQIFGLIPESEPLSSNLVYIDNIQIPESYQLVLAVPVGKLLPEKFQPLIVLSKHNPLPLNARVVSYNFPHLRVLGGILSPSNANLAAVQFNQHFFSSHYLCLGMLPNSHPLSYGLSTQLLPSVQAVQPLLAIPIPPSGDGLLMPQERVPFEPMEKVKSQLNNIPPTELSTPSTPSIEEILIRSLEQFAGKYPNAQPFNVPDNFHLWPCLHDENLNSQTKEFPVGLVPKSMPPNPKILSLVLPDFKYSEDIWTDFKPVALLDGPSSMPSYFKPLIMSPLFEPNTIDNSVRLPIIITKTDKNNETQYFQFVLVENASEPIPTGHLMCVSPNILSEHSFMTTPKTSSDPDTPDNLAIHPRFLKTKANENTTETIPATSTASTTISSTTFTPTNTTMAAAQQQSGRSKSFKQSDNVTTIKYHSSKKSWKQPTLFEPSVRVIKRTPIKARESFLWSLFGY